MIRVHLGPMVTEKKRLLLEDFVLARSFAGFCAAFTQFLFLGVSIMTSS